MAHKCLFWSLPIGLSFAKADIYNSFNFVMLDTQSESRGALEIAKWVSEGIVKHPVESLSEVCSL